MQEIRKHFIALSICFLILAIFIAGYGMIELNQYLKRPKLPETLTYIPQFVLLSFDGSRSVKTWEDTRNFAKEMNASGEPLHFTYFINAAYLLTEQTKNFYEAPEAPRGESNIGFGFSVTDVRNRIEEINKAKEEGHEIASHTVGHFIGNFWSKDDWEKEFTSFNTILSDLGTYYPNEHLPKLNLTPSDIVGFRAPGLGISPGLYDAVSDFHFAYDSSEVSRDNGWPSKDARGVWHIPLGTMFLGPEHHPVIAMDYNIYMLQTGTQDLLKKGTPEWDTAYRNVLNGYLDYFNKNYGGSRAPVLIGHHFEEWNDDLYWDAMKEFAREVCGKPEVKCVSFKELTQYLNTYGTPGAFCSSRGGSCDIKS